MSLRFLGWDIGLLLKILDAGVLELADEADSKSVGLITRAGSTPATGTTPNGSQTLGITGFAGFFYAPYSYVCPSHINKFAVCRLIFGGTLEGHSTLSGGIYAQNRISRRNL